MYQDCPMLTRGKLGAPFRTALGAASVWFLFASVTVAGPLPVTTVDFAAPVTAKLQTYGEAEGPVLRSAILAAISRETGKIAIPRTLTATVVLQDIVATHPTRKQLSDDPALDPISTRTLGGAKLTGYLRDENQRVVATIDVSQYAPTLALGSPSVDPWADARVAIGRFAARLAAACRDRADGTDTPP